MIKIFSTSFILSNQFFLSHFLSEKVEPELELKLNNFAPATLHFFALVILYESGKIFFYFFCFSEREGGRHPEYRQLDRGEGREYYLRV